MDALGGSVDVLGGSVDALGGSAGALEGSMGALGRSACTLRSVGTFRCEGAFPSGNACVIVCRWCCIE